MYKNEYKSEEYRGCQIDWYYDECADDPRNWDNVGHMICWHRRYQIGDKHDHDINTALPKIVFDLVPYKTIWEYMKSSNKESSVHVEFKEVEGEDCKGVAILTSPNYSYKEEWACDSLDEVMQEIMDQSDYDWLTNSDCIELLKDYAVVKPISIYDHSGVTIWFGAPNDRWDSGYVGFGYMTKKEVMDNWPSTSTEENWREEADKHMEGEMSVYREYVEGNVYGFVITDENGDDIDSCWGYYGDDGIDEQMPECRSMVDRYLEDREAARIKESVDFWNSIS